MQMWRHLAAGGAAAALIAPGAAGGATMRELIGRHVSAQSLSDARITTLPRQERDAWRRYLARSRALMRRDKQVLRAEQGGRPAPARAPKGPGGGAGMPLDRDPAWYGSAAARHVADNIVSYQTPAGGWSKNQDRTGPLRKPGQPWAAEDVPWAARDIAGDPDWAFIGTIDNNGTTQELRFLARVQRQLPGATGERYRRSFVRGVGYLLAAQYPNGGWSEVFPLMGGYHDSITFNDGATAKTLAVLEQVAARSGDYAFVPPQLAHAAGQAARRGYRLVLDAQVRVDGVRTIWGQQHDPLTLAPDGARAWEPAALSADESAGVLIQLMSVADPSADMRAAIVAGVGWLRARAIHDHVWPSERPPEGRRLERRAGAGPIWARLYDIVTGKPTFGARDKSVYSDIDDLPADLRNSYQWFGTAPAKALAAYDRWVRRPG